MFLNIFEALSKPKLEQFRDELPHTVDINSAHLCRPLIPTRLDPVKQLGVVLTSHIYPLRPNSLVLCLDGMPTLGGGGLNYFTITIYSKANVTVPRAFSLSDSRGTLTELSSTLVGWSPYPVGLFRIAKVAHQPRQSGKEGLGLEDTITLLILLREMEGKWS